VLVISNLCSSQADELEEGLEPEKDHFVALKAIPFMSSFICIKLC
jgi:hypothetical protein